MITQFKGENRRQAIVNNFSLDIVQEKEFLAYVKEMGYSIDDNDEVIESLYSMWNKNQSENEH